MDPAFITGEDWTRLFNFVHLLWTAPLAVIGFAFSLLTSKAIVPSLVSTHNLSLERARTLQRTSYGIAAISLGLLAWILFILVGWSDTIGDIYARWWI